MGAALWDERVTLRDRVAGCLLAGAVGDALGAPVEFLRSAEIHRRFGPAGVRDFAPAYGRVGAITDDTQMTLFTAEGLIRAKNRMLDRGTTMPLTLLHRAYLRWLVTQGETPSSSGFTGIGSDLYPGWLSSLASLHARRAPGNTCLSALRKERGGTTGNPINTSKGCGGVMRVAPIGLAMGDASFAYELGCDAAAITHGHPSGYIAAGAFACLISRLTQAVPLDAAVQSLEEVLRAERNSEEVRDAIFRAYEAARRNPGRLDVLETLGEGWVAEEAFAISLYCVLSATNLEEAIVLAVNHGGDSDSTGSIAGNILGVVQGKEAIPSRWLEALELRDEIESMAGDLWDHFHNPSFRLTDADLERYPPN